MKTLLMLTLMSLGPAFAQGFYTDLFDPSPAALEATCTEGYQDGSLPIGAAGNPEVERHYAKHVFDLRNPNPEGFDLYDIIPNTFQSTLGGIYNICFTAGQKLDSQPTLATLRGYSPTVLVYMYVVASSPSVAKDHNTVLVFKDRAGKELARYQPSQVKEGEDFKVNCRKTPCTWSGQNIYDFTASKMPNLQEHLKQTARITVLMSRGRGIESFDVQEGATRLVQNTTPVGPKPEHARSGVTYTLLSDLMVEMNKVDPETEYVTIFDDQITLGFKGQSQTLHFRTDDTTDYIRYKEQAYISPEVLEKFNCQVLGFEAGQVKVSCPEIRSEPLTLTGNQWD